MGEVVQFAGSGANTRAPDSGLKREPDPNSSEAKVGPKKKCVKCHTLKTLDEFGNNKETWDGKTSYCKVCRNGLHKKRQERYPWARLKHHMATRITYQLESRAPDGLTRDLEKYLGYRIKDLARALDEELREREGKSLRDALNEGYHVDHILPLMSFKVFVAGDEEFRKCWAISNLRAIPALDNLKKGSRTSQDEQC